MSKDIAVRISNVKKSFKLPTESTNSLKRTIVNYFKGIKGYRKQEVLRDISFEVEKGDFFWNSWSKWKRQVNTIENHFSDLCT